MSDFFNGFWNWYIVVLTVVGIVGCAILLWAQSTTKAKLDEHGKPELTTGHVWDEDLSELNTPMPRWWMIMFWITIFFSIGYLVLYPGLGTYQGTLGWKSTGEYETELKKAEAEYGPLFAKYASQDMKAVAADPQAQAIGERLFLTYCAQCHGSDARGNKGFPNLTDGDWLYGGAPEVIKETILKGRHGQMPPMAAAVGTDQDVEAVAHYVRSLSGLSSDPVKVANGQPKFAACAACHAADGKGNQMLGAPNLTDKTWLYGGSAETIMETIRNGRNGVMPAWGDFLGEQKAHVLSAYVWSLSNKSTAPSSAVTTASK